MTTAEDSELWCFTIYFTSGKEVTVTADWVDFPRRDGDSAGHFPLEIEEDEFQAIELGIAGARPIVFFLDGKQVAVVAGHNVCGFKIERVE